MDDVLQRLSWLFTHETYRSASYLKREKTKPGGEGEKKYPSNKCIDVTVIVLLFIFGFFFPFVVRLRHMFCKTMYML